jgi:hypothetical protein
VALLLFWASRDLSQPALVPIGPAFYPRILFGVTAVLGAGLLAVGLLSRRERPAAAPAHYRLVVLAFTVFASYVFLLPVLGYRAATLLFVAVLQTVLALPRDARAWGLVAANALGTTLVTYYVFEAYLNVLLPRGRLTGF